MKWSNWTDCSAICGRGIELAKTLCQPNIGDDWVNCSSVPEYKDELDFEWVRDCNTWDSKKCPNPCETYSCPDFAKCIDLSTLTDPVPHCECQMGRVMLPETGQCIKPLPPPPTPRPIPVLDEVSFLNTCKGGLISERNLLMIVI